MSDRKITDPFNVNFKPFDLYGKTISGMSWHKVSYNSKNGYGSYILKMNPGAKSLSHKHINYEEFLILDGELIDADNKIFKKNDLITFDPGTTHSSFTKNGCLILVFMRGINEPI